MTKRSDHRNTRYRMRTSPSVQNRETYRSPTRVGSFEVCVLAHIALRMLSAISLASQWHFLANKHAALAGCSAFWPVNCTFLHKNTRTRCTAEWDFCISSYSVPSVTSKRIMSPLFLKIALSNPPFWIWRGVRKARNFLPQEPETSQNHWSGNYN